MTTFERDLSNVTGVSTTQIFKRCTMIVCMHSISITLLMLSQSLHRNISELPLELCRQVLDLSDCVRNSCLSPTAISLTAELSLNWSPSSYFLQLSVSVSCHCNRFGSSFGDSAWFRLGPCSYFNSQVSRAAVACMLNIPQPMLNIPLYKSHDFYKVGK